MPRACVFAGTTPKNLGAAPQSYGRRPTLPVADLSETRVRGLETGICDAIALCSRGTPW